MKAILINKENEPVVEIEAINYYPRYITISSGTFEYFERTIEGVKYVLI